MAELGFRRIVDMIGRTDVLDTRTRCEPLEGRRSGSVADPGAGPKKPHPKTSRCTARCKQDHGLQLALDNRLIELARPAIEKGERVERRVADCEYEPHRWHHAQQRGLQALGRAWSAGSIRFTSSSTVRRVRASAPGIVRGVTLELEGDSNDYVGKGLSGGRMIVYPPKNSRFEAEDNIIIGNVALYGATDRSRRSSAAGRRSASVCVTRAPRRSCRGCRRSWLRIHDRRSCVILGPTGRNFAAGMSGGIAYVWDVNGDFESVHCNTGMVDLDPVEDDEDISELRELIEQHLEFTGSEVAQRVLDQWPDVLSQFVKVMPTDYKRVLGERKRHDEEMESDHP